MDDFDFFTGTWDVTNRWRKDFLDSGSAWEEFPGISQASRHFEGNANFDEITFPTKGFSGLTLRLYNPDTGQWSLTWASKRTGTLFPPVMGQFKDGIGEFYGEDTYNAVPILARYVWSGITPDEAHWVQAFSTDGGQTWLDNWYMDLTRRVVLDQRRA
ncbi:MAG TPA: hypothetical protein VN969_01805 [Streptosporangiaceae bacterium]|nr:hypothetical protein [Streptosporangiaceae bacterium]